MKNFPLIGLGIATKGTAGHSLDTFFPCVSFKNGEDEYSQDYDKWDALLTGNVTAIKDATQLNVKDEGLNNIISNLNANKTLVLCRISENLPIESIEEAYLKLHLISYKYFVPNSLNLENLFDSLVNLAWTNQGPIELDEIEILSSPRIQIESSQNSISVLTISQEQINNSTATNISELLQQIAGLDVRRRGIEGMQADLYIRGGSFDQTLLLIDGIKVEDPQTGHHTMNMTLPLEVIEKIEIVKGAASRMYGQNAFTGAVNILSLIHI